MYREHFLPTLFTDAEPADIIDSTDAGTYIGQYCHDMQFGQNCYDMQFGQGCYNMQFGQGCGWLTFGQDCGDMQFGQGCDSMQFGKYDRGKFDPSKPAEEQPIWSIRFIATPSEAITQTLYPEGSKQSKYIWDERNSYHYKYAL